MGESASLHRPNLPFKTPGDHLSFELHSVSSLLTQNSKDTPSPYHWRRGYSRPSGSLVPRLPSSLPCGDPSFSCFTLMTGHNYPFFSFNSPCLFPTPFFTLRCSFDDSCLTHLSDHSSLGVPVHKGSCRSYWNLLRSQCLPLCLTQYLCLGLTRLRSRTQWATSVSTVPHSDGPWSRDVPTTVYLNPVVPDPVPSFYQRRRQWVLLLREFLSDTVGKDRGDVNNDTVRVLYISCLTI